MSFDTAPLQRFLRHVTPASINVQPDADGLVRRVRGMTEWAGRDVPTMPVWLAGHGAARDDILMDYSIDIRSIPTLSFVDLLRGTFDRKLIAGRRILVGAGAIELGDWISVPRYRALSGPLVQALAFETLTQGRALRAIKRIKAGDRWVHVPLHLAHKPIEAPPQELHTYGDLTGATDEKIALAMIEAADRLTGQVVKAAIESGYVVLAFSDNGTSGLFDGDKGRLLRGENHVAIRGNLTVEFMDQQQKMDLAVDVATSIRILDKE